jgi:hypothetical protein
MGLGQMLTSAPGTWSGEPAFSYQWLREGSIIASATASTYVITQADQGHTLRCEVVAVNEFGVAAASSSSVAVPGVAPKSVEPPLVLGSPEVAQPLTCLTGTWIGAPKPTFSYRWLLEGTVIPSASEAIYVVTPVDQGHSLSCEVIATNKVGVAEAASENHVTVGGMAPVNVVLPVVSGKLAEGEQLTCSEGLWDAAPAPPTYSYQWRSGGEAIPGATSDRYTVTSANRGFSLSCEVTAVNSKGEGSAVSESVLIPGIAPENTTAPQISGTAAVGQQLTCQRGDWNGAPPPHFTYKWLRDGASIASATEGSYTVQLADQGKALVCTVTATNAVGTTEASSAPVVIPSLPSGPTIAPEQTFPAPAPAIPAGPSAAKILATLRSQLSHTQRAARLSRIRKAGLYSFWFNAPAVGRLELSWWYHPPKLAHRSTNTKPVVLAFSTLSFAKPGAQSVKLRLTGAGRIVIGHDQQIVVTVKGVFSAAHQHPVAWSETLTLRP